MSDRLLQKECADIALVGLASDCAFVLDAERRLLNLNDKARECLDTGAVFTVKADVLSIQAQEADRWLYQGLASFADGLEVDNPTRVFRIGYHVAQMAMFRIPVEIHASLSSRAKPLYLLISRNLSEKESSDSLRLLAEPFGLTRAEIRLCEILALQYSPNEAADLLEISPGTVRQRLKSIFHKTGMRRQSELMSLFKRLL